MVRFVDLRFQGTGNRFAFWDTVDDSFLQFSGSEAWIGLGDLIEDLGDANVYLIDRLTRLCPSWVLEAATDAELGFKDEVFGAIPQ